MRPRRRLLALGPALAAAALLAVDTGPAPAQLAAQSDLTREDVDPEFELTLDHLAMDTRWLGLPPRDLRWSPDGEEVYFRWRPDPEPGQRPETDPWFAVDRAGSELLRLSDQEAARVPASRVAWSRDREVAAWGRDGSLYLWTPEGGTRSVFATEGEVGAVRVLPDGSAVRFSTRGLSGGIIGRGGSESADRWAYEVEEGAARRLVAFREADEEPSEFGRWLKEQQRELIPLVRKRERDEWVRDSVRRARDADRPMVIPLQKGAKARDVRLDPRGKWVTFREVREPAGEHGTRYMAFVEETGHADPREARPKVGAPLPEHRMGIVRFDRAVAPDSVQVTWVDDGTEKETIVHGPWWSPDGSSAVVQILSTDHKDKWIARLDPESGETRTVHHEHREDWIGGPLNGGRWRPGYLEWLPEGDAFGFVSEASGWSMLYLGTPAGEVTPLTRGEWEVRGGELGPDGRWWYLTTSRAHPGEEHLYRLPARGGDLERITSGSGQHGAVVSPRGERVATTWEGPVRIPDLYLLDAEPGAPRTRVTKSGTDAYYRYAWAGSEIVTYPDPEGETTWAEVWEPPEEPNGAAVVHVHGCGECAMAVDRGWSYTSAMLYANYLRQRGYVAASVDYRGGWGHGHAYRTYAYRGMGLKDVDSALPALDLLAREHGVDRGRIGIYGGSYGGFFTIMSLFRHPGEYAAGVALYPVTDWAHYNQGYTSRILNGTPVTDSVAYRRSSPVYYAEGLADPLQIQHGLVDGNVQIQDSFRLFRRLMDLEKAGFDLVAYPMEDHGWDETPTRRDSYRRMTAWFDRHLRGER